MMNQKNIGSIESAKIFFMVDDDVDDHEFFLEALNEIDPSLKCITAINADEAFRKLKEWKGAYPDFIVLDLNLPGMSGKKFLIEIKKNKTLCNIPIIIYSTSAEQKIIKELADLGAAHFISKPNKLQLLCDSLRHLLTVDGKKNPSDDEL